MSGFDAILDAIQVSRWIRRGNAADSEFGGTKVPANANSPHRDLALLVIDVQKEFCDPKGYRGNQETRDVSRHIKSIVPAFRNAGIAVYPIYFVQQPKIARRKIDYYEFIPDRSDTLIQKNHDSAFQGSDIEDVLARDKRKTLLVCGFNLNVCVHKTVMDAVVGGFSVRLLRDLTGNDDCNDPSESREYLDRMREKCVVVTDSASELKALRQANRAESYCLSL